jgi:hypothetical protein
MTEMLDDIPVRLRLKDVLGRLQGSSQNKYVENLCRELVGMARPLVRTKAVCRVSYVSSKDDDTIQIGGVKFTSRVLRVNLNKAERVFPYIITCGLELNNATLPTDLLKIYCLDTIKDTALVSALAYLKDYLSKKYRTAQLSSLAPGSLEDWPITEQKGLFSLFGKREGAIGVRLNKNCVIEPPKSISGILFPTEIRFESCQLCSREGCLGRRAPYDVDLVTKYDLKL